MRIGCRLGRLGPTSRVEHKVRTADTNSSPTCRDLDLSMNEQSDSEFFTRSAEQIARRLDEDMSRALEVSAFSPLEKLALACRLLADEGHARTLAGQITVRAESRETFWTTNFGAGLAETS